MLYAVISTPLDKRFPKFSATQCFFLQGLSPSLTHSLVIAQRVLQFCKGYRIYISTPSLGMEPHWSQSHSTLQWQLFTRTVCCLFTGVLHTSVQSLVWLLLSQVADPLGSQTILYSSPKRLPGVILPWENQNQTKVLSGLFGSSDVAMPQERTAVYVCMNGSWASGT